MYLRIPPIGQSFIRRLLNATLRLLVATGCTTGCSVYTRLKLTRSGTFAAFPARCVASTDFTLRLRYTVLVLEIDWWMTPDESDQCL